MDKALANKLERINERKKEHVRYEDSHKDFEHYLSFEYGEIEGVELKEEYVLDFEHVRDLKLSKATPSISIQLNSAMKVEIDNYIIDYWGYFLSPLQIQVYMTLVRWSFQKGFTNISTHELAERMNKTPKTIQGAIRVLEENFFLMKVYRKSKKVRDKEASNSNLFIRLRDKTPLLNASQVSELPKFMQIEHEKIIEEFNDSLSFEEKPMEIRNKKTYLKDFLNDTATCSNKLDQSLSFLIKEHGVYRIAENLFHVDYDFDYNIKSSLEPHVSKPTYDTIILSSLFIKEGGTIFVVCKDKYCEEAYNSNLLTHLLNGLISDGKLGDVNDFLPVKFSSYYKTHYDRNNMA